MVCVRSFFAQAVLSMFGVLLTGVYKKDFGLKDEYVVLLMAFS